MKLFAVSQAVLEVLVEAYEAFGRHRASLLAAGLAFFGFFSLFPLLLFSGAILGYVLESPELQAHIFDYVEQNIPGTAQFIEQNIQTIIDQRGSLGAIGLIALLWSGTNVFAALAQGLSVVYEIEKPRPFLLKRLVALAMFLMLGFLLILSFTAGFLASVFRDVVLELFLPGEVLPIVWSLVTGLLGIVITLAIFLAVYRIIPRVEHTLKDVWPGALAAGFAWEAAKYAFAYYLDNWARFGEVYGSLATVIVVMLWAYVSSSIVLFGGEINAAYLKRKRGLD